MADKRPIIVIKKKGGHAGHHGGAWKVAYADFVTAMMSLFIVLWLMGSDSKVKEAVAGYFNDPKGSGKLLGTLMSGKGDAAAMAAASTDALQKLKEKIEAEIKARKDLEKLSKQVEITVTPEGLRIELIEGKNGTFYESGSARLSEGGQTLLALLASELKTIPNSLLLEGHTDAAPYSNGIDGYSNWDLSADRANSARRVLQQSGVRGNQVTQVRGYADQMLRVKNDPLDPSNRRISILVKNDVEAIPLFSAEKIVNGSTPLPGSPKDPHAKDPEPKEAAVKGSEAKPAAAGGAAGAKSTEAAKAGSPPLAASVVTAPAASPSPATGKPAGAKPAAGTPVAKPGLLDRLKAMIPGHKT